MHKQLLRLVKLAQKRRYFRLLNPLVPQSPQSLHKLNPSKVLCKETSRSTQRILSLNPFWYLTAHVGSFCRIKVAPGQCRLGQQTPQSWVRVVVDKGVCVLEAHFGQQLTPIQHTNTRFFAYTQNLSVLSLCFSNHSVSQSLCFSITLIAFSLLSFHSFHSYVSLSDRVS